LERVQNYYENTEACNYLVYGEEVGEKGTPHIQGYVEFKTQKSASAFNKNLNLKKGGNYAHCKIRLGIPLDASGYCCKGEIEAKPDEGYRYWHKSPHDTWKGHKYGSISKQGERTDLKEITDKIMAGSLKVSEIKVRDPILYHKYGRTLNDIEDLYLRKQYRTEMTQGIWLYGPTGVGKSHLAFMDFDPENCYEWKKDDKGWQDGYCGQEIVIINEFRGDTMKYDLLLELVDKWPKTISRRGREPVPFLAKTLIITSSLSPEEVFCNRSKKDKIAQLHDRFIVKELKGESRRPARKSPNSTILKLLKSSGGEIITPPVCDADFGKKSLEEKALSMKVFEDDRVATEDTCESSKELPPLPKAIISTVQPDTFKKVAAPLIPTRRALSREGLPTGLRSTRGIESEILSDT
jgi:hypothetical protein